MLRTLPRNLFFFNSSITQFSKRAIMPGKARGKSKSGQPQASIDELRQKAAVNAAASIAAGANKKSAKPPTTDEWNEMVATGGAAPAAATSSADITFTKNSKHGPKVPNKKKKGDGGGEQQQRSAFIPPGAEIASRHGENRFRFQFEPHFTVPKRIRDVPCSLVEAVNDFHFAMMNDLPRNEFYYNMLKDAIVPGETTVLEIGAGSGLLSMMAASLGAKWVIAVEGSEEMARLCQRNIDVNKFTDKVRVLNKLSTDLGPAELPSKPDVLVSEIFGTLLMGESALEYIEDIRARVLKPTTKILPRFGRQYCCLVECPMLDQICHVQQWRPNAAAEGDSSSVLDLSHMNTLRDTASCVFTKKYGFRMSTVEHKRLTEPVVLLDVDFQKAGVEDVDIEFQVPAVLRQAGTGHAVLFWWAAWNRPEDGNFAVGPTGAHVVGDQSRVMSTCVEATRASGSAGFCRDMQWGQAIQLLDGGNGGFLQVTEEQVAKKEPLVLNIVTSYDRVILQVSHGDVVDAGDDEEDEEEGGDEEWEDDDACC